MDTSTFNERLTRLFYFDSDTALAAVELAFDYANEILREKAREAEAKESRYREVQERLIEASATYKELTVKEAEDAVLFYLMRGKTFAYHDALITLIDAKHHAKQRFEEYEEYEERHSTSAIFSRNFPRFKELHEFADEHGLSSTAVDEWFEKKVGYNFVQWAKELEQKARVQAAGGL